ncbi:hypothetical protein MA16_Dca016138 [Dendrobium catenatum]|uniref:Uncharacterized protein n=1 Tax=Dendrobium catenatum TaxID=906689 RepID=A0A2I0WI69_9ASPA|nr:hypothetical protein MA16_Dca016138 [Dendrobium catenatum]
MCSSRFFSSNSWSSTIPRSRFLKKAKAACLKSRVRSGNGRSARLKKRSHGWQEHMKIVNIRLYLKNNCIMEENKRLREIAIFLRQENQTLQSHIEDMNRSHSCTLQS